MFDIQTEFDRWVQQLKVHKIWLPDPVLAYKALMSTSSRKQMAYSGKGKWYLIWQPDESVEKLDMAESDKSNICWVV